MSLSTARRSALAIGAGVGAQLLPTLTSIAPLRRSLMPRLAGTARGHHIALTFDDGPDAVSTHHFLELLASREVLATFFLLGDYARLEPALVREMAAAGHELAVHGWRHDCIALVPPSRLARQLVRSRELVEDLTGQHVTWYRPPYGVLTTEGLYAARRAGLTPVLWSAWGVDWSPDATPGSIVRTVRRSIRPGGTVLLHDTDRASASGSWRRTLAATEVLLDGWAADEVPVGPLREHW
jgi:peptidoglycan/xylan/chitin deacetylase (PgdA/CDA1 family)